MAAQRAKVITVFLFCLLVACSQETGPVVSDIGRDQVAGYIGQSGRSQAPLLLDVRSTGEFEGGHIPGSVNIPHDQLSSRISEIETHRDRAVVVYCERGGRAANAAAVLRNSGFTMIQHMEGDMSGWRAAGLPIE